GVEISSIGSPRRLIGQPGDKARWTWTIAPTKPGKYTLDLVVTTYQARSNNPISIVNPPIEINLQVKAGIGESLGHEFSRIAGKTVLLGSTLGALLVIIGFFSKIPESFRKIRAKARRRPQARGSSAKHPSSRKSGRSHSGTRRP